MNLILRNPADSGETVGELSYTLEVTSVPEGYAVPEPVEFTVDSDMGYKEVDVKVCKSDDNSSSADSSSVEDSSSVADDSSYADSSSVLDTSSVSVSSAAESSQTSSAAQSSSKSGGTAAKTDSNPATGAAAGGAVLTLLAAGLLAVKRKNK